MHDDHTVSFRLSAPNVAFLDYMTMAILPQHLLEGEDMAGIRLFPRPRRHGAIQARKLGRRPVHRARDEKRELFQGRAEHRPHHLQDRPRRQCAGACSWSPANSTLRCSTRKTPQQFAGQGRLHLLRHEDRATTAAFSSTSGTTTGPKTATSSPPSATPSTGRPSWTRCCSGRACRPTARCSGTSIITRTLSTTTITPKRRSSFWNPPAARWAQTATTSETARRSRFVDQRHVRRAGSHRHRTGRRAAAARGRHPLHCGHPGGRWTGAARWRA